MAELSRNIWNVKEDTQTYYVHFLMVKIWKVSLSQVMSAFFHLDKDKERLGDGTFMSS
jgi:hypothetical protein